MVESVKVRLGSEDSPFSERSKLNIITLVQKGKMSEDEAHELISEAQASSKGERPPEIPLTKFHQNVLSTAREVGAANDPLSFYVPNYNYNPYSREPTFILSPIISEAQSTNFASAVGVVLGQESNIEGLRRQYENSGNIGEWEAYKRMWLKTKDQELARAIIDRTIKRGQELGFSESKSLSPTSPVFLEQVEKAKSDLLSTIATPELSALMTKVANDPTNRDEDAEVGEHRGQFLLELNEQINRERVRGMEMEEDLMNYWITQAEKGFDPGTFQELIAGFAGEFIPFTWTLLMKDLSKEVFNIKPDYPGQQYLPGSIAQKMREKFVTLSAEEKEQILEEYKKFIQEHPIYSLTDFRKFIVNETLFNENVLQHSDPDNLFATIADNVAGILDLALVGGLVRWIGKPLRTARVPFISAINRSNKSRSQQALGHIVEQPDASVINSWNITKDRIVQTQLPKPRFLVEDNLEDIPDYIIQERERIRGLQKESLDVISRSRGVAFDPSPNLSVVQREVQRIEESWNGRVRPGLSSIQVMDDNSGIHFFTVIGKSDKHGFRSLRTALEQARSISPDGSGIRVLQSDGGTIHPILTGREGLKILKEIKSGKMSALRGNYYVEFKQDYFYSPLDVALFGTDPVIAPRFLGRANKFLLTPSAQFSKEAYSKYAANFLREQALISLLDRIVGPVFRLSNKTRREVDKVFEWGENFSRENGRAPSIYDISEAFPDAGPEVLRANYLIRQFFDTIYTIQNERVWRDWTRRGFKTLKNNLSNMSYHGVSLEANAAIRKIRAGSLRILDPETNTTKILSKDDINTLYKEGGTILETDLAVSVGHNEWHRLILNSKKNSSWELKNLDEFVLKYIPGYYTRIYEDFYFIHKTNPKGIVDGVPEQVRFIDIDGNLQIRSGYGQVTHVASTRDEAEEAIRRLRESSPEHQWDILQDSRLSEKDRVSVDRNRMQLEGRLFFDERNLDRLPNVNGNPADIVSPINTLHRVSQMVSRQVSMEDLVKSYKSSFIDRYGYLVPNINNQTSSQTRAVLNLAVSSGNKEAIDALQLWDYINIMDGASYQGGKWFRKQVIDAAEWLDSLISGKTWARSASKYLTRNAGNVSPLEATKSLAFFSFITARPVRQLALQSMQHLFIAPIDPVYTLTTKLQLDSTMLLMGAKRRAMEMIGGLKIGATHRKIASRLMGISEKEYDILVSEFDKSGLTQTVNIHLFAGDKTASVTRTPSGLGGDIAQKAFNISTIRPIRDAAQHFGFDMGEQFNLSASYMMALRQYRKQNNIKNLANITKNGWEEISVKASDYGLAMHRANAAAFQYGLLSLPTQFMQFTHKVLLTYLQAITGGKIGNRGFTVNEARRILAGQMILFGGGAFALKEEFRWLLEQMGIADTIGDATTEAIAGGLVDHALDKSFSALVEDPDLDLALDEFLAPGANIVQTGRHFIEAAFETSPFETALGPSSVVGSRIYEGIRTAMLMTKRSDWTPEQKAFNVFEAVAQGLMGGYNDFLVARVAAKSGFWLSQTGEPKALTAKRAELWAKGLFGINPQKNLDAYRILKNVRDFEISLKEIAKEYHSRSLRVSQQWGEGQFSKNEYIQRIELEKSLLEALEPEEFQFVMEEFAKIERTLEETRSGVADVVAVAILNGYVPTDDIKHKLATTPSIEDEQARQAVMKMIDQALSDIDYNNEQLKRSLDKEISVIGRTLN